MVKKIKWVGTLSTTERNNIGLIQVRQNNVNSEVLGFNIVDGNGEPYDLKNRKVLFCTYFDKLAPVEQYAEVIENGKIVYTMNEHDMQKPVRINFAYFKIMDDKDNLVDTTQNFSYDIMPSIESKCMNAEPYIIRLEEVLDAFNSVRDEAMKEMQQIIIDFNEQVIKQQQDFEFWFESIRDILESIDPGGILLSEIVTSRGEFSTLGKRLDDITNDIEEKLTPISNSKVHYNGPVVTIIDDDLDTDFRTVWNPILKDYPELRISVAMIAGRVKAGIGMTLPEIKELQKKGHDILNHTTHHIASYEITPEEADADYRQAIKFMKDNDFPHYDLLVYPGGLHPLDLKIKDVARKYFRYAVSTETAGIYANSPTDTWCVPRPNADIKTIEQLKGYVDKTKNENTWLVLMTHSHILKEEGSQKMREFIDYCKTVDVPIMKFSEAVKLKGNAISIGEYTDGNSTFVGVDGKTMKTNFVKRNLGTSIRDYPLGESVDFIQYVDDPFLKTGGTLLTYKYNEIGFAKQLYIGFRSTVTYARYYNTDTNNWSPFKSISGETEVNYNGKYNLGVHVSLYKPETVSVTLVSYLEDTYLSKGGILYTHRFKDESYSYQRYITAQGREYLRKWDNNTENWLVFKSTAGVLINSLSSRSVLDKPLSDFDNDCETKTPVNDTVGTPENQPGIYTVYRFSETKFSYSEYKINQSNKLYRRFWDVTGSKWGAFEKVSSV
ncbi:BppU family phage baseplate upper protein [Vagococcus fluvialis]|uniref:BppU family phage baseplate upper protein n=1 Tax=Vagococcus fluvialis TaxID=2738 RepID=UPI001D0BBDDF|nr:BppU family phage baseplate upper protein [Vagococcus fluvialis]UDM78941.1 BppU family phage baseplate upper protein [Vagococcus fluvialis]